MAERVDVCIAGSGFGGSIAAWRLAELYVAAGADPSKIVVLERGRRFKHTDFKQSMDVHHLSSVYDLIQSVGGTGTLLAPGPNGGQVVTANMVGGGSNLYLAASIRSPTETFERRDHRADDGGDRRMWPRQISRRTVSTKIVTPTDLCSWNSSNPRASFGIEKPRASWNAMARAISQ